MDSAVDRVRAWAAQAQERAAAAEALAEALARVSATAHDGTGAVAATVDVAGRLVGLHLGESALSWRPARLAAQIMDTVRAAEHDVAARVALVADQTVGLESPTGAAVLARLDQGRP